MAVHPNIYVLLRPSLYAELFSAEADQRLRELGELVHHESETNLTAAQLAERIAEVDILITGWGTPKLDEEVLAAANRLQLVAHSAGSIKAMLPPAVFQRGVKVTHAAVAIAPAVVEMTVLLIMLCLRKVHTLDRQMKAGTPWAALKTLGMGRELAGSRVGVVGAGYTGRGVIRRLAALDAEVWVYDPYLRPEQAAALGVHSAALDDLLRSCPIVTMQAPPTAETYHMIGARELALLPDGAIFVNTARSHLVDQEALLAELQRGRIEAALDVFDEEPLPPDHPFRRLENVILTPHVAGASLQARLRQGSTVVDEIERFCAGEALRFGVTEAMLETMA
jgi:phosphoglycerate dehydrogenase-like enzyme